MEVWKDIEGYYGYYQVSNFGRVKSLNRLVSHTKGGMKMLNGKILNPALEKSGYLSVTFSFNGKLRSTRIHRLVAEAFIPNPENKNTVNHINGVKSDNRVENLEWNTQSENLNHAFNIGLSKSGDRHYLSKITNEQALKIRELFSTGEYSKSELARIFNINRKTCSLLINGNTWKHI